jgi:hypothetical protein
MREKNGKAPRPRFHVYFPIDTITDSTEYSMLKEYTRELYTYFDKYAADTARFFFGNPDAEINYFEGTRTLTEFIKSLSDMPIPLPGQQAPPERQAPPAARISPLPDRASRTESSVLRIISSSYYLPSRETVNCGAVFTAPQSIFSNWLALFIVFAQRFCNGSIRSHL